MLRKRFLASAIAIVLSIGGTVISAQPASASAADGYTGTHFGQGNLPPGCENDTFEATDNACYHMRTGMNGLDSSDVDVLLMVPASPTATRDMRIMRQAVEMWNGGIHYLAPQMGVPWMKNMHFHISTDIESAAAGAGVVTYPIVDPEIVVIATNPVGGAGIGIDPYATLTGALGQDENMPCAGVANPFDMDTWRGMPGYDHHDHEQGATVTEDCGGAGGNVCFALTPAIDPAPPALDVFNLFDLVAHEFGHCLTIGHVGDGAEGPWSKVPTNDIMSYNTDPPGLNKCVSTLDVEGIAVTQSHYIDTNNDGVVDNRDHVDANQAKWDATTDHFQAQNPRDHFYASNTGTPTDCPQPDLGVLPGTPPTNWQPTPTTTTSYNLTVTGPSDGATASDGNFNVQGTVDRVSGAAPPPTSTSGSVNDSQSDAHTGFTEIKKFSAATTATQVTTKMWLKNLPPTGTTATSPSVYSVEINGRRFDSFIRYPKVDPGPMTWDAQAAAYLPAGTSRWWTSSKEVDFSIPRSYLAGVGVTAPYYVDSLASVGGATVSTPDDRAPDGRGVIGLAAAKGPSVPPPYFHFAPRTAMETKTFEHDGGNTFYADQSTGGVLTGTPLDQSHHFSLNLPTPSDVTLTLDWGDATGASDLDLHVTGAADSGTTAASSNKPEVVSFNAVKGTLGIDVEPFLVADEVNGVTYTLTAQITSAQIADRDGDGVADDIDACPDLSGNGADGCPVVAASLEKVLVYVDGALAGSQDVDTAGGADTFGIPVKVPAGAHTLRIDWLVGSVVRGTATRQVTSG
ncbi:MAG: hypothetical protein QOK28_1715 [Actinomycetota bacterium]